MKQKFIILPLVLAVTAVFSSCQPQQEVTSSAQSVVSQQKEETDMTKEVSFSAKTITTFGRVAEPDKKLALDWTNSGFSFRFRGTKATVMMGSAALNLNNKPVISVVVDGKEVQKKEIRRMDRYTLCENLPEGEHTVSVIKITETLEAPLIVSGLELTGKNTAEILTPPQLPKRKIEFIGDSITCGFGNLGKPSNNEFKTSEEDGLQTYAALTAKHFGSDAHFISVSGKGIVNDCNGNPTEPMPMLYEYVSFQEKGSWDFSTWQPDIVVINAGTNDVPGGVTPTQFSASAFAFLNKVREKNPNAPIIWCYGMMNQEMAEPIKEAVERFHAEKGKTYFLKLDLIRSVDGEVGSAGHPKVKAHEKASEKLIAEIKKIMQW